MISVVAIGTISHVSAENVGDNVTDRDIQLNDSDLDDNQVTNYSITTIGGDCDNLNSTPNQMNWTVVVINPNNISAKIQLSQAGMYFGGKTITVKVIDFNNKSLYGVPVTLKFSNGKSATVITKSDGKITYNVGFNPGNYKLTATINSNFIDSNSSKLKDIKIKKAPATIILKKLSTSYGAKKYLQIKVINSKTKKGISGVKLLLKLNKDGKVKKVYLTTDSKGIAKFNTAYLGVGIHKVQVNEICSGISAKSKTSQINVKKASTTFLDEVGAIYIKKADKYNIAIFNKNTEKSIKGVKLTVKIFDGKKFNTYVVKTGKYGAQIDIGYLGLGSYKVIVSFAGNSKYMKCSAYDYIDIIRSSGNVIIVDKPIVNSTSNILNYQ